jgi:hypothetical protein
MSDHNIDHGHGDLKDLVLLRINERFDAIDRRFDQLTNDILKAIGIYFANIEKKLEKLDRRLSTLERKPSS